MPEITLDLNDNSVEIIGKFSKEQKITRERLCEMIINEWATLGGRIWSGDYKKARAFLIDWPVRRNLIKPGSD